MRGILLIVCSILAISTIASDANISEEVWIDGDSFYKSIRHKKQSTIYFEKWSPYIQQFLEDDEYFVAIQLNESFDPLPEDDKVLPSLKTIAAIGEQGLTKQYFEFLERYGRTHGISYMVLPDTSNFKGFEREVIDLANQISPYYFLHEASLSRTIPTTKKEFEAELNSSQTIWVVNQDINTKKLNKWSQKADLEKRSTFYDQLKESRASVFSPAFKISEALAREVFFASTVAIDPTEDFPLKSDRITYLGFDHQLKRRLKQYVKVLEYRMPGVPCLVDMRTFSGMVEEDDILIQVGLQHEDHTTLVLPEVSVPNQDILVAKMLFGAEAIVGRANHPSARRIENLGNLGYSQPDLAGMNINHLNWVDTLASEAISKFATPGLQLVVVKDQDIIYDKSFGYYTYDSLRTVSKNTLYDIASLTKVMATLPAVALLLDQGKIQLDDSISMHLDIFLGSNKSGVTIRQLLAHQGGLRSYVPFWSMTMDGDRLDAFYYKTPEDEANDVRTYGLEPHPNMVDSLKSFIVKSKLIKNLNQYNYSDLGFMILHLIVEEISGLPFDAFVHEHFYQPMGLKNTYFNPMRKGVSPASIAPTEYDQRYRNYQVWGEVHDRNALVFGGVAGHAGLFSNAIDLAKMTSMLMNDGYYNGTQYISSETLDQLNVRYYEDNRRGLGWDKKDGKKDAASSLASDTSFGHTGFTGTMVWADPAYDLIYVFLSNRIYPDANNWKLGTLQTRTSIHDVIYQSLERNP